MPEEATTVEATETTVTATSETPAGDDLATLKETLKKERDARKALERDIKPLRQFHEERTKTEQTEAERLQARIADLESKEAKLTQRERSLAVRDGLADAAAAEKLTLAAKTATVIRLLDLDAVEFDDDGTAKNLGAMLRQLAKDEPSLFDQRKRPGSADAGATSRDAPLEVGIGPSRMRFAIEQAQRQR